MTWLKPRTCVGYCHWHRLQTTLQFKGSVHTTFTMLTDFWVSWISLPCLPLLVKVRMIADPFDQHVHLITDVHQPVLQWDTVSSKRNTSSGSVWSDLVWFICRELFSVSFPSWQFWVRFWVWSTLHHSHQTVLYLLTVIHSSLVTVSGQNKFELFQQNYFFLCFPLCCPA